MDEHSGAADSSGEFGVVDVTGQLGQELVRHDQLHAKRHPRRRRAGLPDRGPVDGGA